MPATGGIFAHWLTMKSISLFDAGRMFVAAATAGTAILQFWTGSFARLIPPLPGWVPWQGFWPHAAACLLLVCGVAIATGIRARPAAMILGAMIIVAFVFLHVPVVFGNPSAGFVWTNPSKALALGAGILLLAASLPAGGKQAPTVFPFSRHFVAPLAAIALSVFLVICGVQHFVYMDFATELVPAWIPFRPFWTAFTGAALIAGGIGTLIPITARAATVCTGWMILSWVVLLHIPRAVEMRSAFETAGVFEALAMSGIAFILASGSAPKPARKRESLGN